ncbi:SDR family oxidoreductase [Mucilaginibacter ginsenosidivorans]|uniref:SDR family oxidoreductase n=1 Tax=Mucilaginibacter ginsenosidivorans TaxID=398053 RepID=A0A5B8UXQ6_9SPHI|nr:SDR family oxidoreductase [Mucilaginibacter ginsenosidivorans]QEC63698.1 SDR family oxidoreductase [Mucilaginibacter ginsenosidivorans]
MTVSILGCGWYGKAFGRALAAKGFTVKGSSTSADKLSALAEFGILPFEVRAGADSLSADPAFFDCDALVVSIPPRFRRGETADYLPKLGHIINTIKQYGIKKVIYTSSTGVYGDTNSEVDELSNPQPAPVTGAILREAENLFETETAFKTAILRFGGLIGEGREPGRFFAGKTGIPNGRAPVNLISLEDCVGITEAVIANDAFGYVFNACSPEHPPKAEFYRAAAAKAGLPLPEFLNELLNWKIVNSVNVPEILGYRFTGRLIA